MHWRQALNALYIELVFSYLNINHLIFGFHFSGLIQNVRDYLNKLMFLRSVAVSVKILKILKLIIERLDINF